MFDIARDAWLARWASCACVMASNAEVVVQHGEGADGTWDVPTALTVRYTDRDGGTQRAFISPRMVAELIYGADWEILDASFDSQCNLNVKVGHAVRDSKPN